MYAQQKIPEIGETLCQICVDTIMRARYPSRVSLPADLVHTNMTLRISPSATSMYRCDAVQQNALSSLTDGKP